MNFRLSLILQFKVICYYRPYFSISKKTIMLRIKASASFLKPHTDYDEAIHGRALISQALGRTKNLVKDISYSPFMPSRV